MFQLTPRRENIMIARDGDKWNYEKPIVRGRERERGGTYLKFTMIVKLKL